MSVMAQCPFHIVTIANDLTQYADMRASFEAAGFTDAVARYTVFDNSVTNVADPYEVLRTVTINGASEPYIVLCHQDIRLDLGHGAADLLDRLTYLDRKRPRWAIAGNAGTLTNARWALHLNEPLGKFRQAKLPRAVWSLDENLLIIRRGGGPLASDGLSGFHLYGTDACLCAGSSGRKAYIIDFLLTHLSSGNPHSRAFADAREALIERWRPCLYIGAIRTVCTELRISRWRFVEAMLANEILIRLVRHARLGRIYCGR